MCLLLLAVSWVIPVVVARLATLLLLLGGLGLLLLLLMLLLRPLLVFVAVALFSRGVLAMADEVCEENG